MKSLILHIIPFWIIIAPIKLYSQRFPSVFEAVVKEVKDGDTVDILYKENTITVRLEHIDCPENAQAFAKEAKKFTSDFCLKKKVNILNSGKFDRYGRLIAVIEYKGTNLNKALVKKGFASFYEKYSKDTSYLKLQNQAKQENLGIWSQSEITKNKFLSDRSKCKESVYICNSISSKSYHISKDCKALLKCKDNPKEICKFKAEKQYGRILCGFEH